MGVKILIPIVGVVLGVIIGFIITYLSKRNNSAVPKSCIKCGSTDLYQKLGYECIISSCKKCNYTTFTY